MKIEVKKMIEKNVKNVKTQKSRSMELAKRPTRREAPRCSTTPAQWPVASVYRVIGAGGKPLPKPGI